MRHYCFLCMAFLLWSLSSSIVVKFKNILPPFQSASLVLILSACISTFCVIIVRPEYIISLIRTDCTNRKQIFLLGFLGFFLYPIFYFYGLHSPKPLEANILNYVWPIIALSFGFLLKVEKVTSKKIAAVVLGFLGVLITASTMSKLDSPSELRWEGDNIFPYLISLVGATSYGLYSALIKRQGMKKCEHLSSVSKFIGFLWTGAVLHVCFNFLFFDKETFTSSFNPDGLIYLVFYALFNFSLAYFLWFGHMEHSVFYIFWD